MTELAEQTFDRPPFLTSALRLTATFANSWLHIIPMLIVGPFSRRAARAIYRNWARVAYRIIGMTYALHDDNKDQPIEGPQIFVWLNQSSLAEQMLFVLLLPPHGCVCSLEYASMPFLGWARVLLGDIIIVRQWHAQAKRGIERAAARIANGEAWMISIEGTRTPDGRLLPYKKGPVVMALKTQATIIPIVTRGGRAIMPRGEWRVRPGHVDMHLLKAIPTRGLNYDDRHALVAQLRGLAEQTLTRGEHPAECAAAGTTRHAAAAESTAKDF